MPNRSRNYYLTRSIVRALFWLAILAGLYLISSGVWYTPGGYCVGSVESCFK